MTDGMGKPVTRLDGNLKVRGLANYSGDWPSDTHQAKIAHAVLFGSTIPKGKITGFDFSEARAVPGVIEILTHENAPSYKLPKAKPGSGSGENFVPLQDGTVYYGDQHIGAVIAETLEAATQAARLVKVTYKTETPKIGLEPNIADAYEIKRMDGMGKINADMGHFDKAIKTAEVLVDETYRMPIENHNPMEPAATMAAFDGDDLIVYDATQGVASSASLISELIRTKIDKVHTITKFVGGGFGCKGSLWPHQMIAVMAAQKTKRPVRLVLTRQQMFTGVGHRPENVQMITLGAKKDGQLVAMKHITVNNTAPNKDYSERCGLATPMLYKCENIISTHKLVKLNYQVPTFMRAPGHSSGSWALESAMDELAHKLSMDPLDLRMKNYAEADQHEKKPFSSKSLDKCYKEGAEKFGWKQRPLQPGSSRSGDWLIGYGMATATYPAKRFPATAKVVFSPDGKAQVTSATQDIGTGTWTVMAQVAAEYLGLDLNDVHFELGDSRFPKASVSGGSTTMASVGSAIKRACLDLHEQLAKVAISDKASTLYSLRARDLEFQNGHLVAKTDPNKSESLASIMKRQGASLTGEGKTEDKDDESKNYSTHSFGAQFAEVRVHSLTGEVRVARALGAFAAGRIVNPLTARSQYLGGMVMGVGMTLMEKTFVDTNYGRFVTKDLADYHVPVQADIPHFDVVMVDEKDEVINPIGVKGIGEIGITGIGAAITNAVFNATGIRVRELPITPDLILKGLATKAVT